MDVKNAADAAAWLRAWDGAPRKGIAKETIRGLRMAASISKGARNFETAKGYTEAADLIAKNLEDRE